MTYPDMWDLSVVFRNVGTFFTENWWIVVLLVIFAIWVIKTM